jgi:hypothetical protein
MVLEMMEPGPSKPKRRQQFDFGKSSNEGDSLAQTFRHIRNSQRKEESQVYEVMDKLQSEYHMSKRKSELDVVEVGNKLFDRHRRYHGEADVINLDSMSSAKNVTKVRKSIEALAQEEIVKEILSVDNQTVVTFSDDRSKKQGGGVLLR